MELPYTPGRRRIGSDEITDDFARLEARKPIVGPEKRVGISYARV